MLQSEKKNLRWEQIVLRLEELGFATRKQLQAICNLGSDRNAARILLAMERDKLIHSERKEFKVYYTSNKGKSLIGSTSDVRIGQMNHTLMRNDLYIKLGMPDGWDTEVPIQLSADEEMIVDAMYMKNNEYHLVEIDYRNSMKNNREKLEKYKIVKRHLWKTCRHHPTVIWYTVSENRKQRLEEWMREYGIKGRVYV